MKANRACAAFCAALFFCFAFAFSAKADDELPLRFDSLIESVSMPYGIHPQFVRALVWRESRFNPCAEGKAGEIGLMQIRMPVVIDWAKANDLPVPDRMEVFDASLNLKIGIWHLNRALCNWEGHPEQTRLALCEYNAGRSALLRRLTHYNGNVAATLESWHSAGYARDIAMKFEELTLEKSGAFQISKNR